MKLLFFGLGGVPSDSRSPVKRMMRFHLIFLSILICSLDFLPKILYKNFAGTSFFSGAGLFTDIFFWNILYQKTNSLEYRYFCDSNFIALSKMGINNVITPLDKSRYRHESFKKYLQKLFFTKKEHKLLDKKLISLYKNYYLLEMNIEEYFEKSQEVKRIKI